MTVVPYVYEEDGNGSKTFDLYSRLLKDRIILVTGKVSEQMATVVTSQLLYLESLDPEKEITMYINSPGGNVTDGLAIYDTMQYIKPDVRTICIGMAASMGAFLLAGGAPGKRQCLTNSEVMIHQILGGAQGQNSDVQIAAKRMDWLNNKLVRILSENTGQPFDTMYTACDRDNFFDAERAKDFGLIDEIVNSVRKLA